MLAFTVSETRSYQKVLTEITHIQESLELLRGRQKTLGGFRWRQGDEKATASRRRVGWRGLGWRGEVGKQPDS